MTMVRSYSVRRSTFLSLFSGCSLQASEGISKGITETGMLSRRGYWYLILGCAIHCYGGMAYLTLACISRVFLRLCICL